MPRVRVREEDLKPALREVFRRYGFEGASLSRLSEATGLQRASLYHRFPGGKEEMALVVLREVHREFTDEILAPLGDAGDPAVRMRRTATRIADFYRSGDAWCLLETLSLGEPSRPIRRAIEESFRAWVDSLAKIAREAGANPAQARRRAEDAVAALEGALVVSRITGDPRSFSRVVKELPTRVLGS